MASINIVPTPVRAKRIVKKNKKYLSSTDPEVEKAKKLSLKDFSEKKRAQKRQRKMAMDSAVEDLRKAYTQRERRADEAIPSNGNSSHINMIEDDQDEGSGSTSSTAIHVAENLISTAEGK